MTGTLSGIRVLDFTQMMAGPLCSMILGDMGATVIKVEPEEGDAMRRVGEARHLGHSEQFLSVNRSKRSLALDLKNPESTAIIHALAREADIVLENFRPGVAQKLQLGYETIRALNPKVLYCSISGFGAGSADAGKPALDPVIQALSGLMDLNGTQDQGPLLCAAPFGDFMTPMMATIAILGALSARERFGHGQMIEVNMLTSAIFGMKPRDQTALLHGAYPNRKGNESPLMVPYNTYVTSDGRYVAIIAHNDKYWRTLINALGVAALHDDTLYGTGTRRVEKRAQVDALIGGRIAEETLAFWEETFTRHDVIHGPVRTYAEALNLPEVQRAMVHESEMAGGKVPIMGIPLFFSETPNQICYPPPELGEGNDDILGGQGEPKWPE
ncbi:MAG: CaiB/BaiF CoA transferase family protein [Flavobacteriaceae bacterium]